MSGFEQYTLAKFMAQGRYEQHLSRMKARYRQKRDAVIAMLRSSPLADRVEIMEQDAGLHFLVRLDTRLPDAALRSRAAEQGCVWRCCRTITASRRQRPSISWW